MKVLKYVFASDNISDKKKQVLIDCMELAGRKFVSDSDGVIKFLLFDEFEQTYSSWDDVEFVLTDPHNWNGGYGNTKFKNILEAISSLDSSKLNQSTSKGASTASKKFPKFINVWESDYPEFIDWLENAMDDAGLYKYVGNYGELKMSAKSVAHKLAYDIEDYIEYDDPNELPKFPPDVDFEHVEKYITYYLKDRYGD